MHFKLWFHKQLKQIKDQRSFFLDVPIVLLFPRSDLACWAGQSWLFYFFWKSDIAVRWGSWPASPRSCTLISTDRKDGWERANEGRARSSTIVIFSQTLQPQPSFMRLPQMHMVKCAVHLPRSFRMLQFSAFPSWLILLASSTDVVRSLCTTFSGCLRIQLAVFHKPSAL